MAGTIFHRFIEELDTKMNKEILITLILARREEEVKGILERNTLGKGGSMLSEKDIFLADSGIIYIEKIKGVEGFRVVYEKRFQNPLEKTYILEEVKNLQNKIGYNN